MVLFPIYSSASREHIKRVFLDSIFFFDFSIFLRFIFHCSSGNIGVEPCHDFLQYFFRYLFPQENEETFNTCFFHRSWPEFPITNSRSTKTGALDAEHALPYVQCTSFPWNIA